MAIYRGYEDCRYYGADNFDPDICYKCDEELCPNNRAPIDSALPPEHYKRCVNYNKDGVYDRCIKCKTPGDCPKYRYSKQFEDSVNSPSHYTDGKIEVIEYIEDKKLGFCLGNAIKYISRAGKKDPTKEVEDLKKARWYIERRIKELTEDKSNG